MVSYRPPFEKDLNEIRKLAHTCWLFTYRDIYSEKLIEKYVSSHYSDRNLHKTSKNAKSGKEFFILAQKKGSIIGYANAGKKNGSWELLRVYVSPRWIGKGVGRGLLMKIEDFLQSKNARSYCAYSHVKNKLAIAFYGKNGFERNKKKDRSTTSICYLKRL